MVEGRRALVSPADMFYTHTNARTGLRRECELLRRIDSDGVERCLGVAEVGRGQTTLELLTPYLYDDRQLDRCVVWDGGFGGWVVVGCWSGWGCRGVGLGGSFLRFAYGSAHAGWRLRACVGCGVWRLGFGRDAGVGLVKGGWDWGFGGRVFEGGCLACVVYNSDLAIARGLEETPPTPILSHARESNHTPTGSTRRWRPTT